MSTYRRELTTGSGSTSVQLVFGPDPARARVEVQARWMGQAHRRYVITCAVRELSPACGLLEVTTLEHGEGADGALSPLVLDPDDVLLPFEVEYVRVPTSPVNVHAESQLRVMRRTGYAQWTESFDLLLLVCDEDRPAPGSPLEDLCGWLDKAKLRRVPAPNRPAGKASAAVRDATVGDLAAIEAIYDHYVRTSVCTLQTESNTPEQRAAWFARLGGAHPVLVAESAGEILAWGALVPYAERAGYRHTVEDSIYVRHDRRGQGLGRLLLAALCARADALGHRCVVAKIASSEAASLELHAALGFVDAGRLREVGRKFDGWVDVSLLQRLRPGVSK